MLRHPEVLTSISNFLYRSTLLELYRLMLFHPHWDRAIVASLGWHCLQ